MLKVFHAQANEEVKAYREEQSKKKADDSQLALQTNLKVQAKMKDGKKQTKTRSKDKKTKTKTAKKRAPAKQK